MTTTKQYFKVKNGLEFPSQENLSVTDSGGPSTKPALIFDFGNTEKVDSRITFKRSSSASFYDSKSFAKAEENLFLYSNDFVIPGGSSGSGMNIGRDNLTGPYNVSGADTLTEDTSSNGHSFELYPTTGAGTYTYSVFAKNISGTRYLVIAANVGSLGPTSHAGAVYDLIKGIVVTTGQGAAANQIVNSAQIVNAGNGWFRCIMTATITADASFMVSFSDVATYPASGYGRNYYTGNNTSAIGFWGGQIERRSYATDYVSTTTSAIINYIPTLQTASTNIPRLDFDPITRDCKGLLIEDSATNRVISSESFISWDNCNNVTLEQNATVAPNGTTTATKVICNAASTVTRVSHNYTATYNSTPFTISVYAKAGSWNYLKLSPFSPASAHGALFNLSTGVVTIQSSTYPIYASMVNVGNGWYRCSMTTTGSYYYTTFLSSLTSYIGPSDNGDASGAPASGQYLYMWGAQSETGMIASSYISTETQTVFRYRLSPGSYVDSDNLIKMAPANVLRYNKNVSGGSNKLIEGSITNEVNSSSIPPTTNALGSWYFTNSGYGARSPITAPDGSFGTALRVYAGATPTGSQYRMYWGSGLQNRGLLNKVGSFWIRSDNPVNFSFNCNAASSYSGTTTKYWQRVYLQSTELNNGTSAVQIVLYLPENTNVDVWGFQYETGTVPSSYMPSNETFTSRASTATYYDSKGLLKIASANKQRVSYNPSLLTAPAFKIFENSATNLLKGSINLDPSYWEFSSTTRTVPGVVGPDGQLSAAKVAATATNTVHYFRILNPGYTLNYIYNASIFVKAAEYNLVQFSTNGNATLIFNLSTGLYTSVSGTDVLDYGAIPLPNGWFRIWFKFKWTSGDSFLLYPLNTAGAATYLGDGTSGIYFYGAQLESQDTITSYIPTTTASATRAADVYTSAVATRAADVITSAGVTRAADSAYITNLTSFGTNQAEGTIYAEAKGLYNPGTNVNSPESVVVSLYGTENSSTNFSGALRLYQRYSTNTINFINSGGADVVLNTSVHIGSAYQKMAAAYKVNDFALSVNGGTVLTDTSNSLWNDKSILGIGCEPTYTSYNGIPLNGHLKKISLYTKRLTNAELISLTS